MNIDVEDTVTFAGVNNDTNDTEYFSGVASGVDRGAIGEGGDISIKTGSLSLLDGGRLSASTFGQGNAGNVSINARDAVTFAGTNSGYFTGVGSIVFSGAVGNGGNINIQARELSLTDGGEVFASTYGQGDAGNIQLDATESVSISGVDSSSEWSSSGLFASTDSTGRGGDITVDTRTFRISDGAAVDTLTRSVRDGGRITVNANTFEAVNGGQLLTTAYSSGRAGDITVNATDSITISGSDPSFDVRRAEFGPIIVTNAGPASGLFANTAPGSTGNGGNIFIDPIQLTITDGAGVSVASQGQGNAGDLQVQAGSITLDREAFLSATTASGEGGNITLRSQDILRMRHNSNISTAAGGTGNGGNINILADFIVARPSEDSNIIADAIEGRGGNIKIITQGIFGIEQSEQQTSQSDITASSQLGIDGAIAIDTPDVDPSQGLVT